MRLVFGIVAIVASACLVAVFDVSSFPRQAPNIAPPTSMPPRNVGGVANLMPTDAPTPLAARLNGATPHPTQLPSQVPTHVPTPVPTAAPTPYPTEAPTLLPTEPPTLLPTEAPTPDPTKAPTPLPTEGPVEVASLDVSTPNATHLVLDGRLDTYVNVVPVNGTAFVALRFAQPIPLTMVVIHMNKTRFATNYFDLVMKAYELGHDTPFSTNDKTFYGWPRQLDHFLNNEEVRMAVPSIAPVAHLKGPGNTLVSRIVIESPYAFDVAELAIYSTSISLESVPRAIRFNGTTAVLYGGTAPTPTELDMVQKECPLRPMPAVPLAVPPTTPLDVDARFDCVIVSALFGPIEKTAKSVVPQRHECDRILFTNRTDLAASANASGWRLVTTPYHLDHPMLNTESHPFLVAKFYKQQFHRLLPSHVKHAIWLDATLTIKNPNETSAVVSAHNANASMLVWKHPAPYVLSEIFGSIWKYHRVFDRYDYLVQSYVSLLGEGYCEGFWRPDNGASLPDMQQILSTVTVGLLRDKCPTRFRALFYLMPIARAMVESARSRVNNTCQPPGVGAPANERNTARSAPKSQDLSALTAFVTYDLRQPLVRRFLDGWWETTFYHWQDQVTFPMMAWRYGITPQYWPWDPTRVEKLPHGR